MPYEMIFRSEWVPLLYWSPLLTVLALIVVGLTYFLAPALGYAAYNRSLLLASLWVLIAKMTLMIFTMGIVFSQQPANAFLQQPANGSPGDNESIIGMLFLVESGMFILALALFAGGLASLRRPTTPVPERLN